MSAPAAAAAAKQPLDEVMLAMDVVDTLRHRSKVVDQELSQEGRDEELKARLRKIYAAQGIDVPEHVLDEGVAALKEGRFTYRPPRESLSLKLARIYVARRRWGGWALGVLGALAVGIAAYFLVVVAPRGALPGQLQAVRAEVTQLAKAPAAQEQVAALFESGQSALARGDTADAKAALASMQELRERLAQTYTIEIVSRSGERSGVWRTSGSDGAFRNYYIVVEGIGTGGRRVSVPIRNEETGKVEQVERWAIRVEKRVFEQVARDKQDDGIIQNKRVGTKRKGFLEPEYLIPTTGAAITSW